MSSTFNYLGRDASFDLRHKTEVSPKRCEKWVHVVFRSVRTISDESPMSGDEDSMSDEDELKPSINFFFGSF